MLIKIHKSFYLQIYLVEIHEQQSEFENKNPIEQSSRRIFKSHETVSIVCC